LFLWALPDVNKWWWWCWWW